MAINESKQRMEFGGFNWTAAFFGWLVAMAVGAMLIALLSAAGAAIALTDSVSTLTTSASVGIFSAILLLLAMAIAYYAGGYVAGRMSRFDGGWQGTGVWVTGILAAILLAVAGMLFGANYNLLQQLNLPHIPVDQGSLTTGGLTTLLLGLGVTLISALAGAKVGEAYHRRVDLAGTSEIDEADYQPVETARPVTAPDRDDSVRRETGFTRRGAQSTFGERIERFDRNRAERDQAERNRAERDQAERDRN